MFLTPNQLGWNNNRYDVVCCNTCYNEAGRNSCNGEAGLNSCYNKTGRYNCYDKAGRISIFLRIFPYGQPNLVIIFIHQANRGAKLTNTCFILTSLCSIIRKLFKHFRKFPLFLRIPTIFLPELKKKLKFRPQVLFLTNVGTLQLQYARILHSSIPAEIIGEVNNVPNLPSLLIPVMCHSRG